MPVECCICQQLLIRPGSRVSTIPCGHIYHTQCLLDWIENVRNRASCPTCRNYFNINKVIPLLTLDNIDDMTAGAINQSADHERKHMETKKLLQDIMSSLVDINTNMSDIKDRLSALECGTHVELKTREAIIESLKMHVERIKKPEGPQGIFYNQNCIDNAHSSNYDDSGFNYYVDDLEDDELEFNLRLQ
ncbi:E3 ubiquitin-protein ligase trul-1-like isoform X2 [Chironomus tepperi]|uniref:E3 ubiquitin-protein ligase trul-1-like isoform X2 n=1 Tax=Chironomus tepperi TaxID=113505 RepID=UPI00391F1FAB